VISRLDYCNSLLAGAPLATLRPLQRVQNAAARLIFELTPRDHISPSLVQLHWLPARWRIEYKLCCIMHSVHTERCPAYLKNTVQLAAARQSRSDLRSSTTSAYLLSQLKTKFGERAFSHAGPSAWNALPTHILDVPSPNSFRKLLKTHFFSIAFKVY